jgi:hypothetical protein
MTPDHSGRTLREFSWKTEDHFPVGRTLTVSDSDDAAVLGSAGVAMGRHITSAYAAYEARQDQSGSVIDVEG